MSEKEGSVDPMTCSNCTAPLAPGSSFCTACGTKVGTTAPSARRRGERATDGDAYERARARHEFGRIKSIVLTVRSIFWASAAMALVHLLLFFAVAARLDSDDKRWLGTLLQLVAAGELALLVAGALLVLRAPLLWTTIAACYWTLNTVLSWWLDEFALAPGMLVRFVLTASFWFAVAQAGRVQRLMAADPSLQIVRKRIAPERRVVGGVSDQAKSRQQAERRATRTRRWRLLAAVAGGLVLVGFVVRQLGKPPAVDRDLDHFVASWNRGDAEAVLTAFEGGRLARGAVALREELERRGWLAALPALGDPQREADDAAATATFPTPGGEIRARWRRAGARWWLVDVDVPKLQAPDSAAAITAFTAAWQSQGIKPLLALLREGSRERLGGTLKRLLDKRGWLEQRPALGAAAPGRETAGKLRCGFPLGGDEVTVVFEYWHPRWCVVGVSLPRE